MSCGLFYDTLMARGARHGGFPRSMARRGSPRAVLEVPFGLSLFSHWSIGGLIQCQFHLLEGEPRGETVAFLVPMVRPLQYPLLNLLRS